MKKYQPRDAVPDWRFDQYELEKRWAQKLLQSAKGSEERKQYFIRAYTEIIQFLESNGLFQPSHTDAPQQFLLCQSVWSKSSAPKFLEIGCSEGHVLAVAAQAGWDVYGIDVDSRACQRARERLQMLGQLPDKIQNLELSEVSWGEFDMIYHSDVLEHLHPDSTEDFLTGCSRKLKTGGYMVVVTPNALRGPCDASKFFLPVGARSEGLHLKEYALAELDAILRKCGFSTLAFSTHPASRFAFDKHPRHFYLRLKLLLEPVVKTIIRLSPKIGSRIIGHLYFSCVVAQKP